MALSVVSDKTKPQCKYPLSLDRDCPRPVDMTGYVGGQVPCYCDDPSHTRERAFRERKRLEAAHAANETAPPTRPVTKGITDLAAVQRRMEDLRNEIVGLVSTVADSAAAISNPASLAAEVDHVRRDAEARITEAENAQAAAEHAARIAETDRDRAVAMRDAAVAAAEDAIADRDAALERVTQAESTMRRQLDTARSATAAAVAARDIATAEAARLQSQLDQFHAEQARELRELRQSR